ncbi:MAG: competence protein CoiA [Pseudobdellovibrionaceae bacterium]
MKFALVNNQKTEPKPSLVGNCPSCRAVMISKCGNTKVWHWAHKGKRSCDPWWENETTWHREWKSHFSEDWQEVIHYDESGEKHIADIRSDEGLILEFQHSHLKPEEKQARERFYKKMIWVVDGSRLKRDLPRFVAGIERFERTHMKGVFLLGDLDGCFPTSWSDRPIPVFFDFENCNENKLSDHEKGVWCLLPGRIQGRSIVVALKQRDFISGIQKSSLIDDLRKIYKNAKEYRALAIEGNRRREQILLQERYYKKYYRRSRRRRSRL